MNIAIIGAGAVARTFMELLSSDDSESVENIKVLYIFNSRGGVYDKNGVTSFGKLTDLPDFTPNLSIHSADLSGIDLVIDLKSTDMAEAKTDFETCAALLEKGIHLVSGNKGPVVYGYKKLSDLARKNGVRFMCGCACAAALPSVIVGLDAHAGSKISSFEGIVNGTTNYIISNMEAGVSYEAALKLAQDEGIAEKNPSYDVEGIDTAIKTVMLANIIWGTELTLDQVSVTGIDKLSLDDIRRASEKGEKIKLIGKAVQGENGTPIVTVAPTSLPKSHLLYHTDEKYKAIVFDSKNMGNVLISGASSLKGAAAAILRDVVNIEKFA